MQNNEAILLQRAIALAVEAHADQLDKLGKPYILHPLAVMQSLEPHGVNAMIVGVLHDVAEDTIYTLDHAVWVTMPLVIVEAVRAMTRRLKEPYDLYLARVAENQLALMVKRMAIAHNTSPARLEALPADVRAVLVAKYEHALNFINGLEADELLRRQCRGSGANVENLTLGLVL